MHEADRQPLNLLWLQSGGCGGCTLSLFCAEGPDLFTLLEGAGIHILWHPSISEASGSEFIELLERIIEGDLRLDLLCLEGSVVRGPNGSGLFHRLAGTGEPMMKWVERLAAVAGHVVAVGSCAAYGGITAAGGNPSESCGLQYDETVDGGLLGAEFSDRHDLPVINIAGCPVHPNWVTETLLQLAAGELRKEHLDEWGRPRSYADHLVHHGCTRNEFYEYKATAEKHSDLGCMMEHIKKKKKQAHADCN
ncbi:MAG: HupU protein, partial [gamma proteobacterium symbiont of Ctena orbiculata]